MNPVKLFRIWRDATAAESIMKGKATPMQKATQIVALLVQLIGTLGLATAATSWTDHHLILVIIINLLLTVGHALLPSVVPGTITPTPTLPPSNGSKAAMILLALMVVPALTRAQSAVNATVPTGLQPGLSDIYGAGMAFNPNAQSPYIAGHAFEAHALTNTTYTFTDFIAVPFTQTVAGASGAQTKTTAVSTNIGVGIAQKLLDVGKLPLYTTGTGGISWTGSDTSWQFNYGATTAVHVKGNYYIFPWIGGLSSPTINGTRLEGGVDFAFGKTR